MMEITQFMGGTYDTKDYPYVLMDAIKGKIFGRFSTLEKAHKQRLAHSLIYPYDNVMLFNGEKNTFIDWRKKELMMFEKYKNNPEKYLDKYYYGVKKGRFAVKGETRW